MPQIQRYNVLLVTIRRSLEDLKKGIKGLVVMSSDLEEVFVCVLEGRVPPPWLKGQSDSSDWSLVQSTSDLGSKLAEGTLFARRSEIVGGYRPVVTSEQSARCASSEYLPVNTQYPACWSVRIPGIDIEYILFTCNKIM